jgi:hypothetical protein
VTLFYRFTVPEADFELMKTSQGVTRHLEKKSGNKFFSGLFRKTATGSHSDTSQFPAWAQSEEESYFKQKNDKFEILSKGSELGVF